MPTSPARFDKLLNNLYPAKIRALTPIHWTPVSVARLAARFLGSEGEPTILDIGSGAGKFCLTAAHSTPNAYYVGVEQRKDLVAFADKARMALGLPNVSFVHANFTQLNLADFDHFYFYNSFYENITDQDKIDDRIEYSLELYNYYTFYLYNELNTKPSGTRVCTYSGWGTEIPPGFRLAETHLAGLLKCWIKD